MINRPKETPFTPEELKALVDSPHKGPDIPWPAKRREPAKLGFPVTRVPKTGKMRAYAIVARAEPLLFGRKDEEFYGAIWIYPSKKIALGHCGPAGKVIPLDVSFPGVKET